MKEQPAPKPEYCLLVGVLCADIEKCFKVQDGKLEVDKATLCRLIDRNLWREPEKK